MKKLASKQGSQLILKDDGGYTFKMSKKDWKRISKQAGWNEYGEREYHDYEDWMRACRDVDPYAVFDGDIDICQALSSNRTSGIGEWDGFVGTVDKDDTSKAEQESQPTEMNNWVKDPSIGAPSQNR